MKPWSCQPCSSSERSTLRSQSTGSVGQVLQAVAPATEELAQAAQQPAGGRLDDDPLGRPCGADGGAGPSWTDEETWVC